MIIETVFDDRDEIGCSEIGGTEAKRQILLSLLYLSEYFQKQYQTKVITLITNHAEKTNRLTTIKTWWSYLKHHGKEKSLFGIFKRWMAIEDGKVWNQELYEVHNIAKIILPLVLDMGWDKEVQKVQKVLECNKVGYIGRKDYSLYQPLDWFEAVAKTNLPWQHPGIDLLNVSDYASRTGDNCAAIRIEGAVAALAGSKGTSAIKAFIKTIDPIDFDTFAIVMDAIIECFETYRFTDSEILLIWKMAVDVLHIDHTLPEYDSDNSLKIIYLVDLREAINQYLATSSGNDSANLSAMMNDYSPFEYKIQKGPETITFYLPNRWFYKETVNSKTEEFKQKNATSSVDEAFQSLREYIENKVINRWNMAIGFLELLRDAPVEKQPFIDDLFNLTIQYRGAEPWEYDGIYHLYSKMWLSLDSKQKDFLFSRLAIHYEQSKNWNGTEIMPNLYQLSDDIHRMILWQLPEMNDSDKLNAIETLLSMHMNWITASGKKPFYPQYTIAEEQANTTWEDICSTLRERLAGGI